MTLHGLKVDDCTIDAKHDNKPLHVPAGWRIAEGSADDVRVCCAHPWQTMYLVFANGDPYGTAACPSLTHRGELVAQTQRFSGK